MNEESHNDLFEIKINEGTKKLIRKIYPLVSISFVINILLGIIYTSVSIYNFREYPVTIDGTLLQWYLFLYPFYSIIHAIIAVIGGYYYYLFIKNMKQGVVNSDEDRFNSCFKYVYRNAMLFTVSIIMVFLYAIFHVVTLITD